MSGYGSRPEIFVREPNDIEEDLAKVLATVIRRQEMLEAKLAELTKAPLGAAGQDARTLVAALVLADEGGTHVLVRRLHAKLTG